MTFLEMTLSGGVFVLAITLFRALTLRRLPKQTFVALWWAAALRLLVPLELSSVFSVYTLIESLRPKAAAPNVPVTLPVPAAPPVEPVQVPIIPGDPVSPSASFPVWTALWIAGAALMTAMFLIRYVRWQRRFRESLPVDCPGLQTWLRFRRKVSFRTTDQIAAPLTYGVLHPVILFPKTMDLRDEEALACVLAHELAHIRHLDSLFKLTLTAVLCVHWFNPVVWLFYVLANQDMELRCDEAAVLALGKDSRERYALALLRLAENECVPLCGFSHKNGMEERIKAIMRIKKKSLAVCAAALALVLGITTAFATSAKPQEEDRDDFYFDELRSQEVEDMIRSSEETAANWDKVLAPYVPFGLSYTFDDPDYDGNGLAMSFEGHEVRGIFDGRNGWWITEHTGLGTYGSGAVELYAMYDDNRLIGLRLATEEEQAAFTESRGQTGSSFLVEILGESVCCEDGRTVSFTIPEGGDGQWNIWISGRIATEDGMGQSCRYLETESEKGEWVPGRTYSFETADAAYDELFMEVSCGTESQIFDLTLILPKDREPLPQLKLPEWKSRIPEGAKMIWPVDSVQITMPHGETSNGRTHDGVDIGGMEAGTPIYAAAAGTVKESGFDRSDGNYVRLDHGNGLETYYAHCQSVQVKAGDTVALGQTIAAVGSSGESTGPHLHFEISLNGAVQNPESYYLQGEVPSGSIGQEGSPGFAGGTSVKVVDEALGFESTSRQEGAKAPEEEPVKEPGGMTLQREQLVDGGYPTNDRGETYGNAFGHDLVGSDPDLMAAVGTNGESGYISMEESNITVGTSAEEIAAYMNWKEENHVTGYTIPLYDEDHNVIGTFQVGEGGPGSRTFEEMKEAKANGWPNSKGSTIVEKEPKFKSLEEAREAAIAGWVGNSNEGYYVPVGE